METGSGPAVVLGVGLNVSQTAAELPIEAAVSLGSLGLRVDRTALLLDLLARLETEVARWEDDDPDLRSDYRRLCVTVGRRVRVELPSAPALEGTATGIAASGALLVSSASGAAREIAAGDVVHVRAG